MAKVRDYGSKKNTQIKAPEVNAGLVEYKMSRDMAENIIKTKKECLLPSTHTTI